MGPGAIVVTGAAGGIGAAAARALANTRRPLLLCDLHAEPLEAVAKQLGAAGADATAVAGDVTDAG